MHLLTITATPSSFILTTSSLTICETSPRWLAYRYSRLMATKSLLAKKTVCQGLNARGLPSMPQDAEAEASDNCVLYWLSTRLDIQTVNLATASLPTHTCFTILLLFDCKIIFCYKRWFRPSALYRFAPHLQNGITVRTPHESHVTGSQQCHYQKLTLLITAFIAVWLSHYRASAMSV